MVFLSLFMEKDALMIFFPQNVLASLKIGKRPPFRSSERTAKIENP